MTSLFCNVYVVQHTAQFCRTHSENMKALTFRLCGGIPSFGIRDAWSNDRTFERCYPNYSQTSTANDDSGW